MKEKGHYWRHIHGDRRLNAVNFSFELFLEALNIINMHAHEKAKIDVVTKIYEVMKGNDITSEPITTSKTTKPKSGSPDSTTSNKQRHNSGEKDSKIIKHSSEIYITSNRSGTSNKSNRTKKSVSHQSKSKYRRKSSHKNANLRI